MKSYLRNSVIAGREDDHPLFSLIEDETFVRLDGYVIVAKELFMDYAWRERMVASLAGRVDSDPPTVTVHA